MSSFPYAINWSKEHIPAILHVSQSSQELGNAVADVLFGDVSPAGRLVQTWITSIEQLPPILDYNIRNGRTYMYNKNEPLFPFGYGLTYTTFKYSGLNVDKTKVSGKDVFSVSFSIENRGNYDSDEVAQLYASFPESKVERPGKALKGFVRIPIKKGEVKKVTIAVNADDLRYWETTSGKWLLELGKVKIAIGPSSDDIRLSGDIFIK